MATARDLLRSLLAAGGALIGLGVLLRRARCPPLKTNEAFFSDLAPSAPQTVRSLHVYPVKSCAGSCVSSLALDRWGAVGDRRFMVYREAPTPRFVTQRQVPRMALMGVRISHEGAETIRLDFEWRGERGGVRRLWGLSPFATPTEYTARVPTTREAAALPQVRVGIWDDTVTTFDLGDEVAAWLSACLSDCVRLCWTGLSFERPVDARYTPAYALRAGGVSPHVSFGDGYPLLLASTGSLRRLNAALLSRGAAPIPMDRFRPNVVVEVDEPFDEDRWKRIRIGSVEFAVVKGCSRCKIPTIDQASAVPTRAQAGARGVAEPTATLAKFRKVKGEVYFGQNLISLSEVGAIREGDAVVVLERGEPVWDEGAVAAA
jgi:uncharacterized protein YcbX